MPKKLKEKKRRQRNDINVGALNVGRLIMIDGVVQNLRAQLGGPVAKNLQPTQSTQDSEPTMT
ncbi:unnamed protein product [Prunus armeniaca]|uniref:Uncharacterized protein n=1 Tax=Prunus armeniaca TaxID=36596 RepID=A0A6J5WCX7_PRUAR|nr:unnamed protein product [Prunus armeniaca]CAB4299399.1 unnamed protein product [Prunus armeniaca]